MQRYRLGAAIKGLKLLNIHCYFTILMLVALVVDVFMIVNGSRVGSGWCSGGSNISNNSNNGYDFG